MNQSSAPTSGATFSRPCNLSSIKPSLQALLAKASSNSGQLTPKQALFYGELCIGWEYYRDSQPARFKREVDELVEAIGDLPVVVMAS